MCKGSAIIHEGRLHPSCVRVCVIQHATLLYNNRSRNGIAWTGSLTVQGWESDRAGLRPHHQRHTQLVLSTICPLPYIFNAEICIYNYIDIWNAH